MTGKRIASLFLLPRCDMACRFCASEADFSVMSFEQAAGLLASLRDAGVRSVVLGGGEPFLWPHGLARLGRRAHDHGLHVQVCTNGVALPDGFERIEGIDRFILPLESMDPALHDRLRRHPAGHHRLVLRRLETLAGSARELTVSTVVTRENLEGLDEIAGFLQGLAARGARLHAWHLYRFLPVGRAGRRNADALEVSATEYRQACRRLKARTERFRVYRRDDMLRSSSVEFFWFENGRLRIGSQVAAG